MSELNTFGDRLKQLRKEKNLKQSDFGEIFELSPSAIGSYERNLREPAYSHLVKFANFFNVSIDFLLCNSDERLTVDKYRENDTYELFELIKTFTINLNGYTLSDEDKQRLLDIAVVLLWSNLTNNKS